jgi:hypothetical protein
VPMLELPVPGGRDARGPSEEIAPPF